MRACSRASLGRRAAARLPSEAREQARMHLFDALAAALAGTATREGGNAARHLAALAVGGREQPPAPADIVLTLARRIRATELDDLQLESVTTPAAAVVPALLGALAAAGADAAPGMDDVLDALAAGYDVMFTLGLAAGGPGFLYGAGGWPSLVGAGPAAAATAARLLGRDAEEIAHAIALALLLTPTTLRGRGEDGRWLSFGVATASGFQAALAAAVGARGDIGLLDPGLLDTGLPNTGRAAGPFAGLDAALARPWTPGLGLGKAHLKRWASAGQVAAAIDALGALQDAHGFTARDVTAIDVRVPPAYRRMIDQPAGAGRLWSLLSAHYQLATRLCHPEDLFDCARPVLRDSPSFARAMRAVRVHDADWLAARHPESYPAQVEVTLADGEVVAFLSDGRSPAPTWDWDSVLGKAEAVAARAGTGAAIGRLRDATSRSADTDDLLRAASLAMRR
ncbi:MAG TPA: MmgE/PrpD family protein [Trebonia sp.]